MGCGCLKIDICMFTGEVLGFENLVLSIFEFVHALVDCHKFSKTVESALTDLLYYLIPFMQITEEQVSNYCCLLRCCHFIWIIWQQSLSIHFSVSATFEFLPTFFLHIFPNLLHPSCSQSSSWVFSFDFMFRTFYDFLFICL